MIRTFWQVYWTSIRHHRMIILASASPRRSEILEKHGIDHTIIKPEVDETIRPGFSYKLSAVQTVMYLALKKALAVYSDPGIDIPSDADYLLAADTIVYDGSIIGKPGNTDEAFDILFSLKNKMHQVITGMAVIDLKTGHPRILSDASNIFFKNYSDETIRLYIETDPPLDKAGAYAIQSSWGEQVKKIEGDLENIIGLPWHLLEPIFSK